MIDLNIESVTEALVNFPLTLAVTPGYIVEFKCGCGADCERWPSGGWSEALLNAVDEFDVETATTDSLLAVKACAAHRAEIDAVYDALADRAIIESTTH